MTTHAVPAGTPLRCNRNQCNATFPAPDGLERTAFAGSEAARTITMVTCPTCGRVDGQWVFADDLMPKFEGTFDQRGKQRNAWKLAN